MVLGIGLLAPMLAAAGTDEATARRQLTELQRRIEQVQQRMIQTREGRQSAFDELAAIETSLAEIARNQRRLEKAGSELRTRLAELSRQRDALRVSISSQRAQLARAIRAAFAVGRQDTLKLILNGERASDVPRLLRYHEFMSRRQRARISQLESSLRELEQVSLALQDQSTRLEELEREQAVELAARGSERERRAGVLARIDEELRDEGERLARLERNREGLGRLLRELEQALSDIPREQEPPRSFASLRGKLPWPVRGRQLRRYASRREDSGMTWQGVVLAAPLGQDVRAIANGRVVYASELRGFGNVIILEHGEGYMSLYGHAETLLREPGEWVNPGDVIATVGDSGGARGAGLYFEIRHQGEPRDPNRWCSAAARFQAAL